MRLDVDLAGQKGHGLGEAGDRDDFDAFDDGRLGGAVGAARAVPRMPVLLGGGHGHRQRALGGPRRAVEGQFADDGVFASRSAAICPLPARMPRAIGRSNDAASFGQIGRGQVDDDAILRALEAGVDDRPFDAVRAFLDGRFGQADQHRLRQAARRDIDLDLDRQARRCPGAKRF